MILRPNWSAVTNLLKSDYLLPALAVPYAVLEIPLYASHLPLFILLKFENIQRIFGQPLTVSLAWLHFLAVDFFAGRWMYLDSEKRQIPTWSMAPILFLTAMFCPTGIVAYFALRGVLTPKNVVVAPGD